MTRTVCLFLVVTRAQDHSLSTFVKGTCHFNSNQFQQYDFRSNETTNYMADLRFSPVVYIYVCVCAMK